MRARRTGPDTLATHNHDKVQNRHGGRSTATWIASGGHRVAATRCRNAMRVREDADPSMARPFRWLTPWTRAGYLVERNSRVRTLPRVGMMDLFLIVLRAPRANCAAVVSDERPDPTTLRGAPLAARHHRRARSWSHSVDWQLTDPAAPRRAAPTRVAAGDGCDRRAPVDRWVPEAPVGGIVRGRRDCRLRGAPRSSPLASGAPRIGGRNRVAAQLARRRSGDDHDATHPRCLSAFGGPVAPRRRASSGAVAF